MSVMSYEWRKLEFAGVIAIWCRWSVPYFYHTTSTNRKVSS